MSRLARPVPSAVYDTYWRFAAERQAIFFRRLRNANSVWTTDPILMRHKFTNAYRASDRVSQYLIRNVIYRGDRSDVEVFFRTMLFKLFNRIETWQLLERALGEVKFAEYKFDRYDAILEGAMKDGEKIYSAAYIMPSHTGFDEARKHRGHLKLLEKMLHERLPARLREARSMREAFGFLREYPGIGDFLAYQFVTDLNYSELTDFKETEFVVPGPGARDGLRKYFKSFGDFTESDVIRLVMESQKQEFARIGVAFESLWGRPLQLIDCQNLFCEADKYARVAHPEAKGVTGRTRIKQLYRATREPIEYWYPPKWGINAQVEATLRVAGVRSPAASRRDRTETLTLRSQFAAPQTPPTGGAREEDPTMRVEGPNNRVSEPVRLDAYQDLVRRTDRSGRSGREGVSFALLGLYGETGSLLSELKKKHREAEAYPAFSEAVVEEFGDVLWYLADLAGRAGLSLSAVSLAGRDYHGEQIESQAARTFVDVQPHRGAFGGPNPTTAYEATLMRLGAVAGEILAAFEGGLAFEGAAPLKLLGNFFSTLVDAACAADISLDEAASANERKVVDRFPFDKSTRAPLFDENFDLDEQLPRLIEMSFTEKTAGTKKYVIQKLRGVPIGDRLTDNMVEDDGYRFHDVFHLSYAAILGWSPVTRALLRCKRKSNPMVDEVEDGARAMIIEEGVSTWIFNHARGRRFFEDLETLDYSLLKAVRKQVLGFEVDRCPLWQWERAILEGFRVFRQIREHHGGFVTADLNNRQISFRVTA